MKTIGWAMLAGAMLLPMAAHAQQGFTVAAGESVTVTLDDKDGAPRVLRSGTAPVTAFDAAVGAEFSRGDHNDAIGNNATPMSNDGTRPAAPVPAQGLVTFRFTRVAGNGQALLVVENGYDRGLKYHATIRRAGAAAPTDVCLVMPGKVGLEHWPYAIDALDISALTLVPWTSADGISCE